MDTRLWLLFDMVEGRTGYCSYVHKTQARHSERYDIRRRLLRVDCDDAASLEGGFELFEFF